MKRLTLLAVVMVLAAGTAWGQIITDLEQIVELDAYGYPMLFTVEENLQEGDEVYHDRDYTITDLSPELAGLEWIKTYMNAGDLREGDLASFTVAANATLYLVYDQRGDPGDCYADWDVTEFLFDDTDDDADWEPGSILSREFSAGETFSMCQNEGGSMYIIIAEAAAGPAASAAITGPHNVDPGDSVVLEVVTEGFDEGTETYLWDDDSTAATRDLGVVDAGDTGVYTCEVSGDVDGEALEEPIEASFTLWVGVATPLAGGLGLGLLAGACVLAGAVSIGRKK